MKNVVGFLVFSITTVLVVSSCATIVNDANIPLSVSFSDGSSGECTFRNKRGVWTSTIPTSNVMIRRSDDALVYDCETADGRKANGSIRSEMEGGKMAMSVMFWDLGITDAITDKHRTYQGNVVIPVTPYGSNNQSTGGRLPTANSSPPSKQSASNIADESVSRLRAVTTDNKDNCEFIKSVTRGAGGAEGDSNYIEKAMNSALAEAASSGADSYFVVSADTTTSGATVVLEALKCK